MNRLVIDGRQCADHWMHLADDETPSGTDFTVDVRRWHEQSVDIIAHVDRARCSLGVRLEVDVDLVRLGDDVDRFALIAIDIRNAADGRFFSVAARLREYLGYRGELRVTGNVAPDQLSFMRRCGINAFELGEHVDIDRFIDRYQRFYQSSGALTTKENHIGLARQQRSQPGERLRPARRGLPRFMTGPRPDAARRR